MLITTTNGAKTRQPRLYFNTWCGWRMLFKRKGGRMDQVVSESCELLNSLEVALALKISRSHVYFLIRHGRIPIVKIGRNVRVRMVDLEKFIAGNQTNNLT